MTLISYCYVKENHTFIQICVTELVFAVVAKTFTNVHKILESQDFGIDKENLLKSKLTAPLKKNKKLNFDFQRMMVEAL